MATEEKLVAEFVGVKHKKQLGVLLLTSLRVAWAPGEIVQTFQVDYPYQQIKAQRISAESSSKIQLQLVLHTGGHINFHFTATNALEQRQQVKEHLATVLSKTTSVLSPELEAKNRLLKSNPGVYQLYKDLVTTGLITAEEFWSNQSLSSNGTDVTLSQESGLPSAFLADVQAVYDGCNAVRYNLSADVIQAIFKTYPTVKKKHAEMVPQQVKEEEFWTQFFQSQFLHHENRSHQFVDCLSQDQASRISGVDINISESVSDMMEEGYSSAADCHGSSTPLSLVQRCNHHSNRVLEALLEGSSLPAPLATPTSTTQPHLQLMETLSNSESRSSSEDSTHLLCLASTLTSWQLQQTVESKSAHLAVPHLAPGGSLMLGGGHDRKASTLLTSEQQNEVFRHQATIAELLRHFWSCFPARTLQLEAKAQKMQQCLMEYSLKELEEALDNTGDGMRVVQHMQECIARANQHYQKWTTKKKHPHRPS